MPHPPPGAACPPGQYGPGPQYGPDGSPLTGTRPPATLGRFALPRGPLVPAAGVAVIIVIAATAFLLSSQASPPATRSPAAGSTAAAPPSSAGGAAERQAAIALSGLLSQTGADRADVNNAVTNVQSCGKGIAKDVRVFSKAASNRQALLTKLGKFPDRSALPAAMIADLTAAWQASAAADSDLARWASDEAVHCHKNFARDASWQASYGPDSRATNNKQAFAMLWNRIARKDGLATYQPGQL